VWAFGPKRTEKLLIGELEAIGISLELDTLGPTGAVSAAVEISGASSRAALTAP
jgi:hypothetical protein